MADQIASFFWRLDYIQRFYEGDNTVYNEDGSVISFSSNSKYVFYRLINYIENEFGQSNVEKFICQNRRRTTKELVRLWEQAYGNKKTESCFRSQRSVISRKLNSIFPENIVELFFTEDLAEITSILNVLEKNDFKFIDIVAKELQELNFNEIQEYDPEDITAEIQAIKYYSIDAIRIVISKLDNNKLFYIKKILDQPLLSKDYGLNYRKFELLKALEPKA